MGSESIAHEAEDSESMRARGIIVNYANRGGWYPPRFP